MKEDTNLENQKGIPSLPMALVFEERGGRGALSTIGN